MRVQQKFLSPGPVGNFREVLGQMACIYGLLFCNIFCIHFCNFKRKSKVASTLARYKIVSVWKFEQQLLIQKLRKIALKLACDSARFLRSMLSQKQPKCLGKILRLWSSFKKLLPLGHGFFCRGLVIHNLIADSRFASLKIGNELIHWIDLILQSMVSGKIKIGKFELLKVAGKLRFESVWIRIQ